MNPEEVAISSNDKPKELPCLKIFWDADNQAIHLEFYPTEFKTWNFVLCLLDMAHLEAEAAHKISLSNNTYRRQMQAMAEESVKRQIMAGH